MPDTRVISTYDGNAEDYRENQIPNSRRFITENFSSPDNQTMIDTPVSPYSISVVAGIPLFRTHDSQTDYEALVHDLRQIMPNQFPYDNLRTHIALGVFVRNSPGSSKSEFELTPEGRKEDYYADYLDVFNRVNFQPFSLRVEGLYPNGIMLFTPEGNEEQVFDIRRQLAQGLLDKKRENPEFYFDTQKDGVQPKLDTGIVHSTYLRFADRRELKRVWDRYVGYIFGVNEKIASGEMFADPLVVDSIKLIEPRVSREISRRDWYNDEVIEARAFNDMQPARRVRSLEDIVAIAQNLKEHGKKVVTTNGSYDIMHAGHTELLRKAKAEGDVLILLLNSDESIRELVRKEIKPKGRPYVPEDKRVLMAASLESVDYVALFPEDKPLRSLERIRPDVHVKGGSGVPERYREEREFVNDLGGEYIVFNLEGELSTSAIVDKIKNT